MATLNLREEATLPADRYAGALAARIWRGDVNGPSVVAVRESGVFDVSATFPTMRDLCEAPFPAEALRATEGLRIGALTDILARRVNRGELNYKAFMPIVESALEKTDPVEW